LLPSTFYCCCLVAPLLPAKARPTECREPRPDRIAAIIATACLLFASACCGDDGGKTGSDSRHDGQCDEAFFVGRRPTGHQRRCVPRRVALGSPIGPTDRLTTATPRRDRAESCPPWATPVGTLVLIGFHVAVLMGSPRGRRGGDLPYDSGPALFFSTSRRRHRS